MGHDQVLQIHRRDPFAPAFDEVSGAVHQTDVPLLVDRSHIARMEPAPRERGLRPLRIPVVLPGDPGPPQQDFSPFLSVRLHLPPFLVEDLHLEARGEKAGAGFDVVELFHRPVGHEAFRNGGERQRRRLGHSVGLHDRESVLFVQCLHQEPRAGGTAGNDLFQGGKIVFSTGLQIVVEHQPDRRHPGRERDLLLGNHPADGLHIDRFPARQDLFGSAGHADQGATPGVGVEHRNNVEGAILFRDLEHARHGGIVQDDPPVAVDDPLGIARCGGGVADQRRVPFAQVVREIVLVGETVDEIVIEDHGGKAGLRHFPALRKNDIMLHRFELILDGVDDEGQVLVDEHHLVLGVVDDVDEMVEGEAEVRRVERGADTGDPVVEFEMTVRVQRHARHVVSPPDTQRLQRMGESAGAPEVIGIRVTEDLVLGIDGNHFVFREILRRPQQVRPQQQRILHHGTLPPFRSAASSNPFC